MKNQSKTTRIYPEPKTALINWIEENFHEIESYVFTAKLSNNTIMTVHDVEDFTEAMGLASISKDVISHSAHDGEFESRSGRRKGGKHK